MEKFVVIDGNSLINRAFYALPMLKSKSGRPCGATFGFINMMLSVCLSEKPKYLVCVFDAGKHTFRNEMYAEYKANRDHMPEDLFLQLQDLKHLLKTMGVCVMEQPEIEADDIVGSITRKFDAEFILLSGDKDLFQLINDKTTVWHTKRGITDVIKLNEEMLGKEYFLKPYQVIELKAIMGDSSDNIPGVPGIGKVGAMKLIEEYDNLDNIYAHIDEIKGATQKKLIDGKDMAYLSKQLATIKLDVDLNCSIEDCELHIPFNKDAYDIMQELDFQSILKKTDLFDLDGKDLKNKEEESKKIDAKLVEIENESQILDMIESTKSKCAITFDDLSMRVSNGETEYVVYTSGDCFAKNFDKIKKIFANNTQIVCFDAKQIMHILDKYNVAINNYFDVSLAIYVANEMDAEIKIQDALKLNNIETEFIATSLFKLKEIYIEKLVNNFQLKLFSDIELPLVKVLFQMEKGGISIDVEQIKSLSAIYHEELKNLTQKIYSLAGSEFNINSPKQLQLILFDKLGIEYKGKNGTSVEVLNAIQDKHEIVPYIIRYRKISKLISTYIDGMLNYVGVDGKIHTTYMQRTTSTGRLSSREPNLQNLPIRDDEGKALRKMFSSSFGNGTLISADYNQIELRLIANFSGDENMIRDYLSGKDIHTATASKIFNVSIKDVTPQQRRVAKSVNFGIVYGISAYGLSQNINCSPKEAGDFIKKYMEIYPKVKEYGDKCVEEARANGYAKTIMGRVRHIPDINSRNAVMRAFGERVAKNMPLQGSASDIIKIAMIRVFNEMRKQKLKSKLIIQIHDELVVDCFPGESEKVKQILKKEMESVVSLTVPLIVEVSEGKTLFDAK